MLFEEKQHVFARSFSIAIAYFHEFWAVASLSRVYTVGERQAAGPSCCFLLAGLTSKLCGEFRPRAWPSSEVCVCVIWKAIEELSFGFFVTLRCNC